MHGEFQGIRRGKAYATGVESIEQVDGNHDTKAQV